MTVPKNSMNSLQQPLSPPVTGHENQLPLAISYTDQDRAVSVVYPPPEQPVTQQSAYLYESDVHHRSLGSRPLEALVLSICILFVGLGVTLPIAALGAVIEAMFQPEVIIHE